MNQRKFDELDEKIIEESARLYAEIYLDDDELQMLTEAAIADFQDGPEWDILFENVKVQFAKTTERVKDNIATGKSEPMDYRRL